MTTKHQNLVQVYNVLADLFPRDRKTLLVPYPDISHTGNGVHILIDWSNIHIAFRKYVVGSFGSSNSAVGPTSSESSRSTDLFDMEVFNLILLRGRKSSLKLICGSRPSFQEDWSLDIAESLNYRVSILKRRLVRENGLVVGQKEQGVDEMLCSGIDYCLNKPGGPGILVLATGDGRASESDQSVGFFQSVSEALEQGWRVELYSFGSSLSNQWSRLLVDYRDRFCVVYLDEFGPVLRMSDDTLRGARAQKVDPRILP